MNRKRAKRKQKAKTLSEFEFWFKSGLTGYHWIFLYSDILENEIWVYILADTISLDNLIFCKRKMKFWFRV